jgi:GNAT superfamily N-acetyltransferase
MALRPEGYGLLPVLDVTLDVLNAFRCGKDHLDRFLAESSINLHRDRLGLTTVAFHADLPNRAIGYFTLSNDGLPLTTSEKLELGLCDEVTLSSFPAVKLGRLAVSEDLQGQGVGTQLLELVHGEILDSTSLSAARLVIVDADNEPRVISFYKAHGYVESLWAEKQARNHAPGVQRAPPAAIKMIRDIQA